ncbi:MAG: hypothetical protein C4317_04020 [Acidimicrobiia bacterium]
MRDPNADGLDRPPGLVPLEGCAMAGGDSQLLEQDAVFARGEGDNWFRRNRTALASTELAKRDIALEMVLSLRPPPAFILEVGCATAWRLVAVQEATGAFCVGIDVSQEALAEGKRSFSIGRGQPKLARARVSALPFSRSVEFDVVIASFVFHWIDRKHLLRAVAEIDSHLADGGRLILQDFLPSEPTKVPYHHLPDSGIFTYKQDYSEIFIASGLYELEKVVVFDHDDPSGPIKMLSQNASSQNAIPERSRAGAWLIKKVKAGVHRLLST